MTHIRNEMMGPVHWANPAPYPNVEWVAEQANSDYYAVRITDQHFSLGVVDAPVWDLDPGEFLHHETGMPITAVRDEIWRGPEGALEQIVAAHPLGEVAFSQDDDAFDAEAVAVTDDPLYRGLGAGLWVKEGDLLLRRSRVLMAPSHIGTNFIGRENYQLASPQDLRDVDADPGVVRRSKNVVIPRVQVGVPYDRSPRTGSVRHLTKLVSAQVIWPPVDKITGHLPKQRTS